MDILSLFTVFLLVSHRLRALSNSFMRSSQIIICSVVMTSLLVYSKIDAINKGGRAVIDLPDNERRRECDLEFKRMWEALSKGDSHFQRLDTNDRQQDKDIKELQTNMVSLIKTIGGLIKAIWGAVLTIIGMGLTFFVWYVQSLGGR